MNLKENKKGIELSLQSVVVMIILLVVLIVLIVFFVDKYGGASNELFGIGKGAIDSASP